MNENNLDEIKFRNPSKIAPLFGIFFILLSLALYTFLTRPLGASIALNNEEFNAQNMRLDQFQIDLSELKSAQSELELSTEVQRMEILKAVPFGIQQDEVIDDIVEISDKYKIALNSVSFGRSSSPEDGIGALRVNASFEGDFSDLTSFLEGLERNARFFKISTISVQLSSVGLASFQRANFSLSMDVFFQE
jgi:hypothetical protein